jgi:MFS family permease
MKVTVWLTWLCASRASFTLIFTAYSAALPLIMPEWGMNASQAGLIQSAWHAGSLVSVFTVGFLADRYGAKRVFLISCIGAAASSMIFALFASDFISAALLYGLTGLFSGGGYTPVLTLISERYSAARGRAMGFYLAAASCGYAVALVLTGILTPHIGWRGAFIVNACGPVLGTLLAFIAMRGTTNIVHERPEGETKTNPIPLILENKPAMLITWGYAAHSWELLGMKAWMPAFFAAAAMLSGSSVTQAAALGASLTAIIYVTSMAGSISGGWLSDRYGRTWAMLLMSISSLTCCFAIGWLIGLPLWLLTVIAAVFSFTAIGDSSVYSTAITEVVPPRYIGAAYSVRAVIGVGAGILSPWIFGLVLDLTRASFSNNGSSSETLAWALAWSTLAAGALIGPLATWRLRQLPEAVKMADGKR